MTPEQFRAEIEKAKANNITCPHGLGSFPLNQCEEFRTRPSISNPNAGAWNAGAKEPVFRPTPCETCEEWRELSKQQKPKPKGEGMAKWCKGCESMRPNVNKKGFCKLCQKEIKEVEQRERKQATDQPKPRSKRLPVGLCKSCEREKKLKARGLCGPCWMRHKKDGTLDELFPTEIQQLKRAAEDKGKPGEWIEHGSGPNDLLSNLELFPSLTVNMIRQALPAGMQLVDFREYREALQGVEERAKQQCRSVEWQIVWELSQGGGGCRN